MFALIVADPNSLDVTIVSRHRTIAAAQKARQRLNGFDWRWSYIAQPRRDGSVPSRGEVE